MAHQNKDQQSLNYITKSLFAGGIAGCCAKTCIAPLDRIKILFQTSNPSYTKYSGRFLGVFKAIHEIRTQYGVLALFQGHSATLARIFPYAAIKFMSYEQYKIIIMPTKDKHTPLRRLLAGSLAGITSVVFSYPLDIIRVRMAFQVKSMNSSTSIKNTLVSLYNERGPFYTSKRMNGISNFYRGFLPTIYGMIPYAGFSFLTYETLKENALRHPSLNTSDSHLKSSVQLLVGGLSGVVAQTSAYPFEIIRRHMQVAGLYGINKSTAETAKSIWAMNGVKGMFVGLSIGYMKVVPMFAVSFYVYEWMKGEMGIEDNVT